MTPEIRRLLDEWRKEADDIEADGDICCALTRRHDADALEAAMFALLVDLRPGEALPQECDCCERPLGTATHACPHCGVKFAVAAPLPSAEGWHPMETAPKDGTRVLVWDSYDEHTVVAWGWGKWFLSVPGAYAESTDHTFTHWRPLPQAPGAVSAEDCAVDRVVETGQEGTTRDKSLSSNDLPLPAAPVIPQDETGVD